MFIAKYLVIPAGAFLSLLLAFGFAVTIASADHGDEAETPSQATTLHDDDDDENHGLNVAVSSTDVAQLKAYIALLTQLIDLMKKQIELQGGSLHKHDDGELHDHDDANDDHDDDDGDDHDEDDDEHDDDDDDGDDDHDEDEDS